MLETTMIATAERGLRRHRERRQNPDHARQAILAGRTGTTTDSTLPDPRPARSQAGPLRILLRLHLRSI